MNVKFVLHWSEQSVYASVSFLNVIRGRVLLMRIIIFPGSTLFRGQNLLGLKILEVNFLATGLL